MKAEPVVFGLLIAITIEAVGAEDTVDFNRQIRPILERSCYECHGPNRQKGKLRLDSRAATMERDSEDAVIVPGQAADSELYRRIILPDGDDDLMPQDDEPLSNTETDLIRDWINQGAIWPESALPAASPSPGPSDPLTGLPAEFSPSEEEAQAIAQLAAVGLQIRPLAMNTPWTEANFRLQGDKVDDAAIAPLRDIKSLTVLNLANTAITDAGLEAIQGLENLTALHLELTSITADGLKRLRALRHLRYLNLYGTGVTDAGLEHLKSLSELRHLYLWQTKVTEAGVEALQAALPHLIISTGTTATPPPPAKKEDKPGESG